MSLKKVYLEIGNVCDLRCAFCPGTKRPPRILRPDEFRALARKLQGHTKYLYFHLMGEPLFHPDLPELLQIAGELGFSVMITTNGRLLPRRGQILLDSGVVRKVNLSLQSFEANEGGDLEAYLSGCISFVRAASTRGIGCEFRLWNEGGMDTQNGEILAILRAAFPLPWEQSRNGQRLAEKVWLDPGERFDWPDLELDELGERVFCYGLRDQIGVLSDGTVVPCCLDHDGDIPLGNLFEQSLDQILEGPRARAMYEGFSRRKAVEPLCRRCGYARRFG